MRTEARVEPARLRNFELFVELTKEELLEIAETCKEYLVPFGSILMRQGQVGRELFLLEDGTARIYKERKDQTQILATVRAPAVLGELALMTPERVRTASVEALSDLHLLGLPLDQFTLFLRRFPPMKRSFLGLATARASHE